MSQCTFYEAEKNGVIIQPLREDFVKPYLAMFSLSVRTVLNVSSLEQEELYIKQKLLLEDTFFYCIFEKQMKTLIGAIEIRDVFASRGQLYCWLNECYWGSDYFRTAMSLASSLYFSTHYTPYFTAHVDVTNKRGYYALKKCGFADLASVTGSRSQQYVLALRRR